MATPPGMHRTRKISVARASPKPAEASPMPVETCTTTADENSAKKPLQEHSRSCRAWGARPAGPLTWPHGKAFATGREERPISRLQHLREPDRYTRRCSGATVGDSHKGPLKTGGILLKTCKKRKHTSNLTRNTHGTAHAAVAPVAHQSGPARRSLEQGPPRSRARAPLERAPPRSRAHCPLKRAPPRSRPPHERTCSRTRVRAFNAMTWQSCATTRLGITPRRCSANSQGGAHPRHCGGLCDEAGVSSVTLCRPLLYG
jgi:hypothetical protein